MVSKQLETWMKNLLKRANNVKLKLNENWLYIEVVIVIQQHFYNLFSGVKLCIRLFCFTWMAPVGTYIEGFLTSLRTVAHKGQCNKKWFAANKKDWMQTKKI